MKYPTKYTHDCSRCNYLGRFIDVAGLSDLYFCRQDFGTPTVIARYGNEGPEYKSGLCFQQSPALRAATRRAITKGLTKKLWVLCRENCRSWHDSPSVSTYTTRAKALIDRRKYGGRVVRFNRYFK